MGLTLVAVVCLVAAVVSFLMYRRAEAESRAASEAREIAETAQADASNSRSAAEKLANELGQLNTLLEQERKLASSATASAADREALQKEIELARAQVQGSQQDVAKARQAELAGRSEAGGLQQRVDALQQQLAAAAAERDKLQAQVVQGTTAAERAAALQGQLDDERRRATTAEAEIARLKAQLAAATAGGGGTAAGGGGGGGTTAPVTATAQDVTRAFTEGVRAYDLRNWKASAQNMQEVIRIQPVVKDLPKEYRMSGVRFVPHAPHSYLAVALFQMKAECDSVLAELKQAEVGAGGTGSAGRATGRAHAMRSVIRTRCSSTSRRAWTATSNRRPR